MPQKRVKSGISAKSQVSNDSWISELSEFIKLPKITSQNEGEKKLFQATKRNGKSQSTAKNRIHDSARRDAGALTNWVIEIQCSPFFRHDETTLGSEASGGWWCARCNGTRRTWSHSISLLSEVTKNLFVPLPLLLLMLPACSVYSPLCMLWY